MKIIMLGPPGAGKGTVGNLIAQHYSLPIISTGDLLRNAVTAKSELGLKAESYMNKGAYVPDELVLKVLIERLKNKDCSKGYILDGFPRTISQVEALAKYKITVDVVLNLNASKEVIMDRLGGRVTCKSCGAIFHLKNIPPKKPGVCDKCNGQLYQRDDQKPEAIKERLKIYEEQTAPLVDYYKKKGLLKDVNANPKDPQEIFRSAIAFLS